MPDKPRAASFSRTARLLKPAEFERVFTENERARTDTLLVMARPNELGKARLGMVVAKRLLPRAVDRIMARGRIRPTEAAVPQGDLSLPPPSDHLPVFAIYEWLD